MRKKYWYGKEIEGRLYGLETLFVADDFKEFKKVAEKFNHILIGPTLIERMNYSEPKNDIDKFQRACGMIKNALNGVTKNFITWGMIERMIDEDKKMFTIEAKPEHIKMLPKAIILKCHILLWLDVPELSKLKSSDSIKVCPQSHEMHVFTLHNGQKVTRQDYIHDRHDI
jgi:hypothetical protein